MHSTKQCGISLAKEFGYKRKAMTLSKNITIHCSLECLGSIQPTSVFHSTVITVSVHLIPSVDVAISGDTDVSIQTQAY